MAIARVGLHTGANTTFSSSVTTESWTSTSGNALIAIVEADVVAQNGVTVTDNKGNTWNRVISTALAATFDLEVWVALNITGGAGHTVTATDNGGGVDSLIMVEEWSGIASASAVDKFVGATGINSSAANSGATATTTQADELVIGAVSASGNRTFTEGAGYSNGNKVNTTFSSLFFESKIVSATGAQTATATISANVSWVCQVVTLKASLNDVSVHLIDGVNTSDDTRQQYDTHSLYDDAVPYNRGSSMVSRIVQYQRNDADIIETLQTLFDFILKAIHISDTIQAVDNLAQQSSYSRSENESVETIDDIFGDIEQILMIFISNSIFASDVRSLIYDNEFIYDDHKQYDGEVLVQRTVDFSRSEEDSIEAVDFVSQTIVRGIKVFDSVGVSDEANRAFFSTKLLQDNVTFSDYITYLYSNSVDLNEGPTIDAIILRPLPYTEPEKMVIYKVGTIPTQQVINRVASEFSFIGKIYDSHTFYDKHIPYYSGLSSDSAPTNEAFALEPHLLTL